VLTQEQVSDLFDYRDGHLYWKRPPTARVKAGAQAGYINDKGYVIVRLKYINHGEHRLIFLLKNGWMPKIVDHINGDRSDNRIENLRAATLAQNSANKKKSTRNTSGHKNISWNAQTQAWRVTMQINGVNVFIGNFRDIEMAKLIASEYRDKLHKEFANHG